MTNLVPLETKRELQIFMMKKLKGAKYPVSPVWLTFDGLVEAEQFLTILKESIDAFKKNENYDGGVVPLKVILSPDTITEKQ